MIARIFLGMSLVGAEWVFYFLILMSVFSVAIMVERWRFYSRSTKNGTDYRQTMRDLAASNEWNEIREVTRGRLAAQPDDPDSALIHSLLGPGESQRSIDSLLESANDALIRIRNRWDRNLVYLAIIGSNAPFIGLFGTVLGIITAFHQLATESAGGVGTVMSGIAEALVATAVGLFVAIPAVVAFNLLQRRVKTTLNETDALKSYFVGRLMEREK